MGFLLAVFGIIQKFTWNGRIYWFRENTQGGSPFGPFVNRNHFAGYMELVIPLSLGLLVTQFPNFAFSQSGSWRYRLSAWESYFSKSALLIFFIVIMISALFLSLSRGGILSFLFSLVFFIFLLSSKRINWSWRLGKFSPQSWVSKQSPNLRFLHFYFLTSVFLFSILFLLWLGIDPVLERLATLSSPTRAAQKRAIVWQDTWEMSKDFPLLGTGLATYQYIYPAYKTLPHQQFFEHAHNDYLELLAEVGFIPFVLLIGAVFYLWVNMVKGWHKRKNPYIRGMVAGILAATLALLLHSMGEFNFRIPSNALLFSLMLGLGVSLLSLSSSHPSPIKICFHTFKLKRWQQWLLFPCLIVATLSLGFSILGEYLSARSYQAIDRIILANSRGQDNFPFFSSADSQLYFILGKRYMELREKSVQQNGSWKVNKGKLIFDPGAEARELTRLGIENLHKAVELNPSNAYYHLYLGWAYAVDGIDSQRVEREFTLARHLDPTNQFIQHYLKTEFPDLGEYDLAKTLNR
jgi:O-antigen ligase